MDKENISKYLVSLHQLDLMLDRGLISSNDYSKGECLLAKKYCIKKASFYRPNHLINKAFRVIYMTDKMEAKNEQNN